MSSVTDLASLAAFGYGAWQVLGGWYRHKGARRRYKDKTSPFEALQVALTRQAQSGNRKAADFGSGAQESGHSHVVANWGRLSADARVGLVEDLLRVGALTGQLRHLKCVREGRLSWAQLSEKERLQVLGAVDGVRLDAVGQEAKEQADELAQAWVWQPTEAAPLLAEEPVAAGPVTEVIKQLTDTVDTAREEVKSVLNAARASQLEKLMEAVKPLDMEGANKSMKDLIVRVDDLGLGKSAIERMITELRFVLSTLAAEDGALVPSSAADKAAYEQAHKEFGAEVDREVEAARAARTAEAEAGARNVAVNHIVEVSASPSSWSQSAPAALKASCAEVLLGALEDAEARLAKLKEQADAPAAVVEAETKAVTTLASAAKRVLLQLRLPGPADAERDSKLSTLVAALGSGPAPPPAPAPEQAPAEEGEEGAPAPPPPPPPPPGSQPAAVRDILLAALLPGSTAESTDRDGSLSPEQEQVRQVVKAIFSRLVLRAAGPPGAPSTLGVALGLASVDRGDVVAAIKEEAERKAAAHRTAALSKLDAELSQVRTSAAASHLTDKVDAANTADTADNFSSPTRLALAAAYIKAVVLPGSDLSLDKASLRALALLRADREAGLLPSEGAAVVAHAKDLAALLSLSNDLTSRLELGPGVISLLERLASYLDSPVREPDVEPDYGAIHHTQSLIECLLGSGLVLLELPAGDAVKLTRLREAIQQAAKNQGDDLLLNKQVAALKDVSAQLPPVMSAIEARMSAVGNNEERRAKLAAIKDAAVAIYRSLQEFLSLENVTRVGALKDLDEVRDIAYGLKPERKSAPLVAALSRIGNLKAKAEAAKSAVSKLPGTQGAVNHLADAQEKSAIVARALRHYGQHIVLREAALGVQPTAMPPLNVAGVEVEEGEDDEEVEIELPPPEELQANHSEEALFLELYPEAKEEGADKKEDGEDEDDEAPQGEAPEVAEWREAGYQVINRGQVAVVSVAGALDGDVVRGTKDAGLPSTKSPLQLFAERLLTVQRLAAESIHGPGAGVVRPVDWYLVVPPSSKDALQSFFADSAYFGLQKSQVHFIAVDARPPALTEDLKVAMEGPARIARSPSSSGDVFAALRLSGALRDITRRGARCIEVHSLEDNLLARPADPVFLGCCDSIGVDAAAKVTDPAALLPVYEAYAPLITTPEAAQAFSGMLPLLGTYYFSSHYLDQINELLDKQPMALYRLSPFTLPASAPAPAPPMPGRPGMPAPAPAKPGAPQPGYRLDRRLSDWLMTKQIPGAQRAVVFVNVEEEFAPVVGSPPFYIPESSSSAADALMVLHTDWVLSAGGIIADGEEEGVVEVSPLVSYAGEGLERLVEGREISDAYDLDLQGYAPPPAARVVGPGGALLVPFAAAWVLLAAAKVALGSAARK